MRPVTHQAVSRQYLSFVTNMNDICLKRCIQSSEKPLPKLKIRRSQHGLISELHFSGSKLIEDPSSESREQDVNDLCDDDEVELPISTAQAKF